MEKVKLTKEQIEARLEEVRKNQEQRRKAKVYSPLPKGVKVSYFENPLNPGQRLTIVRRFNKSTKTVDFGFSINHPPSFVQNVTSNTRGVKTVVIKKENGDIFSRKEGRQIALDRLNPAPMKATVVGDEYPVAACLRVLGDLHPKQTIGLIASDWYKVFGTRPPSVTVTVTRLVPSSLTVSSKPTVSPSLWTRFLNFFGI